MEVGLVQKINIDDEMQQAYLDYAMSVIVSRALPDARDGLKPVHRRIMYAMYDMGLRPDTSYKKSARIVGEVLGKYHPHGDMAVYDAMARMAQDFSMRLSLVDGQGNFGSIDGDPPAAMRYTEARLASAAMEILNDLQRNTVDFESNFDDTLREPSVLPAAIPNLLVNGATGIAVGMSTSIPPHNLSEVVDALKHLLAHWEKMDDIDVEELMQFIQGPDFPTGGLIVQEAEEDNISSAYGSGRGRVSVQARAHLEEMERGRNRIIVTELPYMTNKASLIERIADLVREERVTGIADLRDESDRQGMRIVIELTKTADPQAILRDLYKHTPMQSTFSIIMLALVDGEPRMLTLKQALRVYLDHRLEVIRRRSEYELERARQRAHILEGLRVALNNLDEIIALIRRSPDAEAARKRLMSRYKLTEIQAQAILDMQLRRLASLERKKIELEYKDLLAQIKELERLLSSPKKIREMAAEQLETVKQTYGDRRRTQIVQLKAGAPKQAMLTARDLIPEQTVWLAISPEGLVSRCPGDKTIRQSGSEAPKWLLRANTRDTLYLVNEQGEAAGLPLANVPETEKPSLGVPYFQLSALRSEDRLAAVLTLPPKDERADEWYVLTATRQGMVKKSAIAEVPGPTAGTFTLVRVNEGDQLGWIRLSNGNTDVLMLTRQGMAIRFSEADVRPMGLVAAGVMGLKLKAGDEVVGMDLLPGDGDVFMVASDGTAKRVRPNQFPRQGRYGQGVVAWKLPAKVGAVGLMVGRGTLRATLHLDKLAPKMSRLDEAPLQGRTARGKSIQELRDDDHIIFMTPPWDVERPMKAKAKQTSAKQTPAKQTPAKRTSRKQTSAKQTSAQKTGSRTRRSPASSSKSSSTSRGTTKRTSPKPESKSGRGGTSSSTRSGSSPSRKSGGRRSSKPGSK